MPTKEAKEGGLVCHNIATDTTHHSRRLAYKPHPCILYKSKVEKGGKGVFVGHYGNSYTATDTTHHSSVVLCPLHSPAVSRVGSETVQCSPAEHQTLARC